MNKSVLNLDEINYDIFLFLMESYWILLIFVVFRLYHILFTFLIGSGNFKDSIRSETQ